MSNKTNWNNIEKLRSELYKLYELEENIQSKKILEKSRELDKLILECQKQKKYGI